ncbi:hypothetical protein Rhal01_03715 [Rubritalea halochordaticola]|uniref:Uncharacterized protein n=1 Tax=Rubritalea halochordaticola TaxID=714537 RepID=A0ABP9V4B8_9BACT
MKFDKSMIAASIISAVISVISVETYGALAILFAFIPRIFLYELGLEGGKLLSIGVFVMSFLYYYAGAWIFRSLIPKAPKWIALALFYLLHFTASFIIAVNVMTD